LNTFCKLLSSYFKRGTCNWEERWGSEKEIYGEIKAGMKGVEGGRSLVLENGT